jgi:hypothetical protein
VSRNQHRLPHRKPDIQYCDWPVPTASGVSRFRKWL